MASGKEEAKGTGLFANPILSIHLDDRDLINSLTENWRLAIENTFLVTRDPQVFPQPRLTTNAHGKAKMRPAASSSPRSAESLDRSYCFGAAGLGAVVDGRGRAAPGVDADGADGTGAATPDEALYAVTTACVTSVL